jgi:hypothetical protein
VPSSRQQGQVLVLLVLSLAVIMIAASLAYDGGTLLLRRRAQQNASDAAALAGARFLPGDTVAARAAATRIATDNGYTQGVDGASVVVNIPPTSGIFAGQTGFIQVEIGVDRASIFAGVIGQSSWRVSTQAVAANGTVTSGGFGVLVLDPSACPSFGVSGQGRLELFGNLQVNSTCTTGNKAANVSGTGTIVSGAGVACNVVGGYSEGGGVTNTCPVTSGSPYIPDPLDGLGEPAIPTTGNPPVIAYPQAPVQVSGTPMAIPAGCPGSATPASHGTPLSCRYVSSYAGTTWRLYPGYYPGGINLESGTFYLEPGIYHVAGGFDPGGGVGAVSFRAAGAAVSLISVDSGGTTLGGGIMIFNDHHPTQADGAIVLQGGSSAFRLYPLAQGSIWDGIVIFQSSEVTTDLILNGGASSMEVRGLIYAPSATVKLSGDTSSLTIDQLIASQVLISGSGTVTVAFDQSHLPNMEIAGLVE